MPLLKRDILNCHLNKMRGIYRAKHDFLLAELKKRSWVEKIYGDHAGLHVLVQVNTEKKKQRYVIWRKNKESVSMESVNMLYGNRSRAVMKL